MATTTTNYNYSNSLASPPGSKGGPPEVINNGFGRESGAEVINRLDAEDRQKEAIQAEREWLAQVAAAPEADSRRNNKIRLVSTLLDNGDMSGRANTGTEQIEFALSPEISESKQVIYAEIGDIREAASLMIYGGSPSRKWSINAKFLSRTPDEADSTWTMVQRLRSWTNPDRNYKYGLDRSIPRVLRLYGYGKTWQGIPVVITSLNVEYPTDIDYIPAARTDTDPIQQGQTEAEITNPNAPPAQTVNYGTLVPVIQTVSFQLTEIRTPNELFEQYNLEKFKLGVLPHW